MPGLLARVRGRDGVWCQGSDSLSWVKPHSELCLLPPTAWLYPGRESRLSFGAKHSHHTIGTAQGSRGAAADPGKAGSPQGLCQLCAVLFLHHKPVLCPTVCREGNSSVVFFHSQPHPLANNPLVVLGACLSVSEQMPGGAFGAPRACARCVLVLISASES